MEDLLFLGVLHGAVEDQLRYDEEGEGEATLQPVVGVGEVGGLGDGGVDAVVHGPHGDHVGDLTVVLGPDPWGGGGEVHGGPGQGHEEGGGEVQLQDVQ